MTVGTELPFRCLLLLYQRQEKAMFETNVGGWDKIGCDPKLSGHATRLVAPVDALSFAAALRARSRQ
jgi:hypothetical protein